MTVISLFHNRLDELRKRYPLFNVTAVRQPIRLNGKEEVYSYSADISEDTALYFNYEPSELDRIDFYHKILSTVKEFNKTYKNLKVFFEDPNVVWSNYDSIRTPLFTNLSSFDSEIGKQKFKELDEKSAFVDEHPDFFICSHCHTVKERSFRFSRFVNGETCLSCAEVDYDGSYS